jgi:hypothetical protein
MTATSDRSGWTPFVPAEIITADVPGSAIRYSYGYNCSGTGQPEVLQIISKPDGAERTYVIMRGLSQAKAQAIAMILNAPENQ